MKYGWLDIAGKLVPLKDIERDLWIRWLEDFRKFSNTCVGWDSSTRLFSVLNPG